MAARHGLRPLKAWRYVGVFGAEIMLCAAVVRIARARQAFWAVWDRAQARLHEGTRLGAGPVTLAYGRAGIRDADVRVELTLEEAAGIETISRSGTSYAWTRKQGGIRATGTLVLDGRTRRIDARAVIDDTAAYYERHTAWRWAAGVGLARDGRTLAWNLVSGVNDAARGSERTIWADGEAFEPPPVAFDADLAAVGELRFSAEAARTRRENLLLVRSSYHQPFGTFSGCLPGGIELAEGYGVMEAHEAWW
jgi:hypothetical protein